MIKKFIFMFALLLTACSGNKQLNFVIGGFDIWRVEYIVCDNLMETGIPLNFRWYSW